MAAIELEAEIQFGPRINGRYFVNYQDRFSVIDYEFPAEVHLERQADNVLTITDGSNMISFNRGDNTISLLMRRLNPTEPLNEIQITTSASLINYVFSHLRGNGDLHRQWIYVWEPPAVPLPPVSQQQGPPAPFPRSPQPSEDGSAATGNPVNTGSTAGSRSRKSRRRKNYRKLSRRRNPF